MAENNDKDLQEEQLEKEALELDKLEVSADPKRSEKAAVASAEKPKGPAPKNKLAPLRNSLYSYVKDKVFLACLAAGLVAGAVILLFISLRKPALPEGVADTNPASRIVYQISTSIGAGNHVELKIGVPFRDSDEKRLLISKLAEVKHALPGLSRIPEVRKSIRAKDLATLRAQILPMVSDITGVPAEKLGLKILAVE